MVAEYLCFFRLCKVPHSIRRLCRRTLCQDHLPIIGQGHIGHRQILFAFVQQQFKTVFFGKSAFFIQSYRPDLPGILSAVIDCIIKPVILYSKTIYPAPLSGIPPCSTVSSVKVDRADIRSEKCIVYDGLEPHHPAYLHTVIKILQQLSFHGYPVYHPCIQIRNKKLSVFSIKCDIAQRGTGIGHTVQYNLCKLAYFACLSVDLPDCTRTTAFTKLPAHPLGRLPSKQHPLRSCIHIIGHKLLIIEPLKAQYVGQIRLDDIESVKRGRRHIDIGDLGIVQCDSKDLSNIFGFDLHLYR